MQAPILHMLTVYKLAQLKTHAGNADCTQPPRHTVRARPVQLPKILFRLIAKSRKFFCTVRFRLTGSITVFP